VPFSLFAAIISLGYEWSLFHMPVREYISIAHFIIFGSRNDLFSQNREGLFSFLGIPSEIELTVRISFYISSWIGCWTSHFVC
jgi:hypothetical protein